MSPCTRNTLAAVLVLAAAACQPEDVAEEAAATVAEEVADTSPLKASVTFHASFDHGTDADFASGDALLYTAPSYDAQDEAESGIGNPDVAISAGAGRFGNALEFKAKNTHAIFYKADRNVALYACRSVRAAKAYVTGRVDRKCRCTRPHPAPLARGQHHLAPQARDRQIVSRRREEDEPAVRQ